jgi:CO/xanthine dehydrogenase Mo-binding subunit
MATTKFGLAQPVRRVEDPRLLKGMGRYTDDIVLPGMLYGIVLRSPHAAASITAIDTTQAASLPGIRGIYTAADLKTAGLGTLPCAAPVQNRDGTDMAAPAHPVLADGTVHHVGDPVAFIVADTAKQARDAAETILVDYHTFPNGCHMAEVEIDPETGVTTVVRYIVCDDFGTTVNPLIVRGQVAGGVAQGLGQAILEHTVFDPDSGQLLSGSFMDYALPRADDLPNVEVDLLEIPCVTNPLGVKGAGEAGAVGSPTAIINAIIDALSVDGVTSIDMPATSEKVWRALAAP